MIISRIVVIMLCASVPIKSVMAQENSASFESFYRDSNVLGWPVVVGTAFVVGGLVFFTGGTGITLAPAIGGWIGSAMGLQGIAATNAGLALLGGGSLAAGGYGVVGGTAVVATTLTIAEELVLSAGDLAWDQYSYQRLAERSPLLPTLELPVNDTGSRAYESAVKKINEEKIEKVETEDEKEVVRLIVSDLIGQIDLERQGRLTRSILGLDRKVEFTSEEKARNEALVATLYFILDDYENAKIHAYSSIEHGRAAGIERGLPAFIYATSSLYDENSDFSGITDQYFEYSIQSEADTAFIPTMFSIYMDRMLLRFEEGELSVNDLESIRVLMDSDFIPEKYKFVNYTLLLSKYNALLGWEFDYIAAITKSTNRTIISSPETLGRLEVSLSRIEAYHEKSQLTVDRLMRYLENEGADEEASGELATLIKQWHESRDQLPQLHQFVQAFKDRQIEESLSIANQSNNSGDLVDPSSIKRQTVGEAIIKLIQLRQSLPSQL